MVFYREDDGTVPLLEWFEGLSTRPQDTCRVKLERLQALGNELRRPEADHLREGIYALRVGLQGVHYRMLYFFHGTIAAVLSHGITTAQRVPARDITLAMRRQRTFTQDPSHHTYEAD